MSFIGQGIHNFFGSKILALSSLIMLICCLACISSSLMPLWLTLNINVQFGDDPISYSKILNVGIFFMDESRFINMLMLDKSGRNTVVPPLISVAQVLYLIGVTGMIVCTATSFILAFRTYSSPPGEMCLAGATSSVAMCLLSAVVCIVLSVYLMPDAPWNWLPVPDIIVDRHTYYRVEKAYPVMQLNYGYYVACFAALLGIGSAVLIWFQACMTCSYTRKKRYQMLRQDYDSEPPVKPGNPAYPVFSNIGYTRTNPGEVDL